MEFSSKLLEKAVNEMAQLPGIGKRTALRLVLHLLKQPSEQTHFLSNALTIMREEIKFCVSCHNISDVEVCEICKNAKRNHKIICVVEEAKDISSLEKTREFKGRYHVLGGVISPIDGIGPDQLRIKELINRVTTEESKEVIVATNPNLEGEATAAYLVRVLESTGILVTRLASGLPVGGELEYADEVTLGRALKGRRQVS